MEIVAMNPEAFEGATSALPGFLLAVHKAARGSKEPIPTDGFIERLAESEGLVSPTGKGWRLTTAGMAAVLTAKAKKEREARALKPWERFEDV